MKGLIQPRVLKGFRDFLPATEMTRKEIIRKLEDSFEMFGFLPIDTPVLEYTEVLLGKGSGETDKQLYRFKDNGKRDVAMRFDLTVPFARFMATYSQELPMPFKRYHISKVWRGENTQKGRYREFMQCDFDIVGCDSCESDFEILSMMANSFKAISIDNIIFKLSHRGLFNDFLASIDFNGEMAEVLRIVDKLAKIGEESVKEQLSKLASKEQIEKILEFIGLNGEIGSTLPKVFSLIGKKTDAIVRLEEILELIVACDMEKQFNLDLSITRGLDYYTGIVYETFIKELPTIGSVCSGGRYNNLASIYTKEELPGVGSSIGLDRLLAALEELDKIEKISGKTDILIMNMDRELKGFYFQTAIKLREAGFKTEVYLHSKKLGAQFKYAEKKDIKSALLLGSNEFENKTYTLKNLENRENFENLSFEELENKLKTIAKKVK